jgi:hypothetical protein
VSQHEPDRLSGVPASAKPAPSAGRADQERDHHALTVGEPAHDQSAEAEPDRQRVGQGRVRAGDAELRLHNR